jgi:hypothetical protein
MGTFFFKRAVIITTVATERSAAFFCRVAILSTNLAKRLTRFAIAFLFRVLVQKTLITLQCFFTTDFYFYAALAKFETIFKYICSIQFIINEQLE